MRKGNARFPKVGALISIASTSFLEISPVLCLIYRGVFFFFIFCAVIVMAEDENGGEEMAQPEE